MSIVAYKFAACLLVVLSKEDLTTPFSFSKHSTTGIYSWEKKNRSSTNLQGLIDYDGFYCVKDGCVVFECKEKWCFAVFLEECARRKKI